MKNLLIFLASFLAAGAYAQSDSVSVNVDFIDSFTGELIEDAKVELLTPDSTYVRDGGVAYNSTNGKRLSSRAYAKITTGGSYLLRLTHKDYQTAYFPFKIRLGKRHDKSLDLSGKVKMTKRPKAREKVLGEAVVTATKIKMVMKGDTIVYNADAFQLSQGSMLDALIEQLPGAQLKDNGVITVNGRVISNLLVNGKDFFRGDPKIALENLPAYMVDKVKVFEQQTDLEKFSGRKETDRPLVMDVNLKKQYSIGWIANAEAAYGTEDKYLGRLFALRFTDCSRLAVFGNINNTNDTRRPGQRGDWTPSYLPDGLQTSKSAGAEYYYENRKKTFEWTSNLNASHTDNHTLTRTSGESFLPANRAFSQSRSDWRDKATSLSSSHRFKSVKNSYHNGSVNFAYDRNSYISLSRAGEFGSDPYGIVTEGVLDSLFLPGAGTLRQIARYRRSQEARGRGENWSVNAPYTGYWIPFRSMGLGDMVILDISGSYDKHTSHRFDRYNLEYFNAEGVPDDHRNRYTTRPSRHYGYSGKVTYCTMPLPQRLNWNVDLSYSYSQDYRSGRNDLFRLDRLDGWGEDTDYPLGTLPSAESDMQQALDLQNSEHSEKWRRIHEVNLHMRYQSNAAKNVTTIGFNLPVRIELEHLLYDRSARHFNMRRDKAFVVPDAYIQQRFVKGDYWTNITVEYDLARRQPDFVNTIELVNDANPLYIQLGNGTLRSSTTHSLTAKLNTDYKRRSLYNLELSYRRTHNALGMERNYNPVTGGYTVRPVNVNGNWSTDGSLSLDRQFGKDKVFSWGNYTSYAFNHNVDMANVEGEAVNALSTIRNLHLYEQLTLDYSRNGWSVGTKVRGSYSRITGNRSDFTDISAWNYNYGLTARIPLPLGIGLSTDFTVFSRRGYEDPALNTDDFVWNARLERSVLNGNLVFMIDGFDLLHDLSKVTRTVNAQGRTESYTNVLPSYFMAHIIYRLNRQPKNKK